MDKYDNAITEIQSILKIIIDKPYEELTNIEKWYAKKLNEVINAKEYMIENECPCHHGLKGYDIDDDDPRCADNNGDIESCAKCWNEVMNV